MHGRDTTCSLLLCLPPCHKGCCHFPGLAQIERYSALRTTFFSESSLQHLPKQQSVPTINGIMVYGLWSLAEFYIGRNRYTGTRACFYNETLRWKWLRHQTLPAARERKRWRVLKLAIPKLRAIIWLFPDIAELGNNHMYKAILISIRLFGEKIMQISLALSDRCPSAVGMRVRLGQS